MNNMGNAKDFGQIWQALNYKGDIFPETGIRQTLRIGDCSR
jgi:hypothetical protein